MIILNGNSCESCAYYAYDDDLEQYFCEMDLDEDEMYKFVNCAFDRCPYYTSGDEYKIAGKQ